MCLTTDQTGCICSTMRESEDIRDYQCDRVRTDHILYTRQLEQSEPSIQTTLLITS